MYCLHTPNSLVQCERSLEMGVCVLRRWRLGAFRSRHHRGGYNHREDRTGSGARKVKDKYAQKCQNQLRCHNTTLQYTQFIHQIRTPTPFALHMFTVCYTVSPSLSLSLSPSRVTITVSSHQFVHPNSTGKSEPQLYS